MLHPSPLVRTSIDGRVRCFLFPPAHASFTTTPPLSSIPKDDHFPTLSSGSGHVVGRIGHAFSVHAGCPLCRLAAGMSPSVLWLGLWCPLVQHAAVPDSMPHCCTYCAPTVMVPLAHRGGAQLLSGFWVPLLAQPNKRKDCLLGRSYGSAPCAIKSTWYCCPHLVPCSTVGTA